MKLASYLVGGKPAYGTVAPDGKLTTVSGRLGERYPTLRDAIAADALKELAALAASLPSDAHIDRVTMLPVIWNPEKIPCIGLNYADHRDEAVRPKMDYPMIFPRFTSSQVGHGQPIVKPKISDKLDYEGELAVVIGRGGRNIPKERALDHVVGYACYNDGSIRDFNLHTTQILPGKNFPKTGAFGPYLVTRDEAPEPDAMTLETRVNGEVLQHTPVDRMLFKIPYLIHYISTFTPLTAGDVISTGTCAGVALYRKPQNWMKQGDVVEVEITGLGILRNPIVNE